MTPNRAQFEAWNGESGNRWVADADRRDAVLAPIAEALLTAAEPSQATRCSTSGAAAAPPLSPLPVPPRPEGQPPGSTCQPPCSASPAEEQPTAASPTPPSSLPTPRPTRSGRRAFDLAISRFGTMFFDDPVAAFTNVAASDERRRTAVHRHLAAARANDWLTVPGAALLRLRPVPSQHDGRPRDVRPVRSRSGHPSPSQRRLA